MGTKNGQAAEGCPETKIDSPDNPITRLRDRMEIQFDVRVVNVARVNVPPRMVVTFPSPLRAFSLLIRERTKFQRLHDRRREIGVYVRMGEHCEVNAVEFPFSSC